METTAAANDDYVAAADDATAISKRIPKGARIIPLAHGRQSLGLLRYAGCRCGLEVHLITDSGKPEFPGQPTNTCLAIGPGETEKIDEITRHLQLL